MNTQKKILCILIAIVIVAFAAHTISGYVEEKNGRAVTIPAEFTDDFYQKINLEENLNSYYDEVLDAAFFEHLGISGFEDIGLTKYDFGFSEEIYDGFEVFIGATRYGPTEILLVPLKNDLMEHKIYRYNLDNSIELAWSEKSAQTDKTEPELEINESLYYEYDDKIGEVLFNSFGYETAEHLGCIEEKISGVGVDYDVLEVFECLKGEESTYCLIPSVNGKMKHIIYKCYSDKTAELLWIEN